MRYGRTSPKGDVERALDARFVAPQIEHGPANRSNETQPVHAKYVGIDPPAALHHPEHPDSRSCKHDPERQQCSDESNHNAGPQAGGLDQTSTFGTSSGERFTIAGKRPLPTWTFNSPYQSVAKELG